MLKVTTESQWSFWVWPSEGLTNSRSFKFGSGRRGDLMNEGVKFNWFQFNSNCSILHNLSYKGVLSLRDCMPYGEAPEMDPRFIVPIGWESLSDLVHPSVSLRFHVIFLCSAYRLHFSKYVLVHEQTLLRMVGFRALFRPLTSNTLFYKVVT